MAFIDYTYFVGDIDVPSGMTIQIGEAIDRYEDVILKSLMGYKLHKAMKEAYDASILAENAEGYAALPQIWKDFIEGSEFEFELNGETITEKWEGLKNDLKKSLISYFVYFKFRGDNATSFSGTGETSSKNENSVVVSPATKMISAWNKMIDIYGEGMNTNWSNNQYSHCNDKPSAYNFLLANLANYPDWKFTSKDRLNIWRV